jgi:hypothetical protein
MIQYIIKMVKYDYKINDKIWNTTDDLLKTNMRISIRVFGSAFLPVFCENLNFFFFAKIECGLYFLDRFDVLMSKMIFKK